MKKNDLYVGQEIYICPINPNFHIKRKPRKSKKKLETSGRLLMILENESLKLKLGKSMRVITLPQRWST